MYRNVRDLAVHGGLVAGNRLEGTRTVPALGAHIVTVLAVTWTPLVEIRSLFLL